jgi:hypothetical protein
MDSVFRTIGRPQRLGRVHVVVLFLGISSSLAHGKSQPEKVLTAAQSRWEHQHFEDLDCQGYAICPGCFAVGDDVAQMLLSGECSVNSEQNKDLKLDCNGILYSRELLSDLQQGLCPEGCTSQAKQMCTTRGRTLLVAGKTQPSETLIQQSCGALHTFPI